MSETEKFTAGCLVVTVFVTIALCWSIGPHGIWALPIGIAATAMAEM